MVVPAVALMLVVLTITKISPRLRGWSRAIVVGILLILMVRYLLWRSLSTLLYFFVPFYLVQITAFSWLNYRSRSAVLSDIYSLVLAFPLAVTVIKVMLNPFGKGFKVTPKGGVSDRFSFNWQLAFPLVACLS